MRTTDTPRSRPRVLIAGGGVGGVEAALALRDCAGEEISIELISPAQELAYHPLTVAEPFGYAAAPPFPLRRLWDTHAVTHVADRVERVAITARRAFLAESGWQEYDALVIAIGARPEAWLPGALTFRGAADVPAYEALLGRVSAGSVDSIAFAAPAGRTWTLPLYELALLTAAWVADHCSTPLELSLVTPEEDPLALFGPGAARAVRDLLGDRGVRVRTGELVAAADIRADAIVTLPVLRADPPDGLPRDDRGFVPIDEHAAVPGAPGVWAVGDVTSFPVKQGGVAAQQADAAAQSIAAALGAPVEPEPFTSVLRGLLLTGVASAYLRSGEGESAVSFNALWSPASKVAGRYLAPYLAREVGLVATPVLTERLARPDHRAVADRDEIRRLALAFAEADAQCGDDRSARRWRETVAALDGVLEPAVEP